MSVPINRVVSMVPAPFRDGLVKTLVNMGQHGLEFGSFNAMSQFAQNYVAKSEVRPEPKLMEGVPAAFGEGASPGWLSRPLVWR